MIHIIQNYENGQYFLSFLYEDTLYEYGYFINQHDVISAAKFASFMLNLEFCPLIIIKI